MEMQNQEEVSPFEGNAECTRLGNKNRLGNGKDKRAPPERLTQGLIHFSADP